MASISFRGSRFNSEKIRRLEKKLSRGFSLLPSLVVMLAVSASLCSLVASRRAKIGLLEKKRNCIEKQIEESNAETESEWLNVAF